MSEFIKDISSKKIYANKNRDPMYELQELERQAYEYDNSVAPANDMSWGAFIIWIGVVIVILSLIYLLDKKYRK